MDTEAGITMMRWMREGGWVMWGLLFFSLGAVAAALRSALVLRAATAAPRPLLVAVRDGVARGRREEAIAACERSGGSVAMLLAAGLHRAAGDLGRLEPFLESTALREMRRLGRGLGVLAVIATTAPLLGFLGTVTGMMASFDALVRFGMSDPTMVALGIKEALTTTAAGLIVAVPTQLVHQGLAGRLRRVEGDLETAANFLLDLLLARPARSGA